MHPAGGEKLLDVEPFETLTSMRNVDKECNAKLLHDFKGER